MGLGGGGGRGSGSTMATGSSTGVGSGLALVAALVASRAAEGDRPSRRLREPARTSAFGEQPERGEAPERALVLVPAARTSLPALGAAAARAAVRFRAPSSALLSRAGLACRARAVGWPPPRARRRARASVSFGLPGGAASARKRGHRQRVVQHSGYGRALLFWLWRDFFRDLGDNRTRSVVDAMDFGDSGLGGELTPGSKLSSATVNHREAADDADH